MTTMTVRPPKQMWIGRPHERRLEVTTDAGAVTEEALPEEEWAEDEDEGDDGRAALKGFAKKGVRGPKVTGPKLGQGGLSVGPQGVRLREPQLRGPRVRGPQLKQQNLRLDQLKIPSKGAGAAAPPSIPLRPTQAVFRQKPWLPWWLAIVVPLLLLLALLLFLFLPKNATVPEVVGKKSAFEAEKAITEAKFKLAPGTKEKIDPNVPPGTVIAQMPKAGEEAEEGAEVAIQIAVGDGKLTVPAVTGKNVGDAEKILREAGLSLGQATPQPVDPKALIKTPDPRRPGGRQGGQGGRHLHGHREAGGRGGRRGRGRGRGGRRRRRRGRGRRRRWRRRRGGGDGGGAIKVPPVAGATRDIYAKKVADLGLAPQPVSAFNDAKKGTLFQIDPKPGTEVRGRPGGHDLRLRRLAPDRVRRRQRRAAQVERARARSSTRSPRAASRRRTRPGAPTAARSPTRATGRSSSTNLADKDGSPIPLTKEGERFRDLAWAPTADVNMLALIKSGKGDRADRREVLALLRRDRRGRDDDRVQAGLGEPARRARSTGRRTASRCSCSRPSRTAAPFGMMQFTTRQAVLGQAGGLGEQGLRHRRLQAGRGRARRGGLARRQAARGGGPEQERDEPAADQGGRHAARGREGAQRARVQGDLAARRARAGRGARGRLLRGHGRARAVAGRRTRRPRRRSGSKGDNPVFQPLSVE